MTGWELDRGGRRRGGKVRWESAGGGGGPPDTVTISSPSFCAIPRHLSQSAGNGALNLFQHFQREHAPSIGWVPVAYLGVFFWFPGPPPHGNDITWKFDVGLH